MFIETAHVQLLYIALVSAANTLASLLLSRAKPLHYSLIVNGKITINIQQTE